jgi:hypothetical protein
VGLLKKVIMDNTTTVEVEKELTGKTVLSFQKPTPMWATWAFRIVFCLTTAATMILTAEPSVSDAVKVRIFLYMKAFDFIVWFFGKSIGIDKKQFENEIPK